MRKVQRQCHRESRKVYHPLTKRRFVYLDSVDKTWTLCSSSLHPIFPTVWCLVKLRQTGSRRDEVAVSNSPSALQDLLSSCDVTVMTLVQPPPEEHPLDRLPSRKPDQQEEEDITTARSFGDDDRASSLHSPPSFLSASASNHDSPLVEVSKGNM